MASNEDRRSRRQFFIGPDARKEMSEMFAWYRRKLEGEGKDGTDDGRSRGRHIRIARTTTNTEFPTYPPAPANTFVIEFGKTVFTETPGLQAMTFTAYDPEEKRIARDLNCQYHEEGTIVVVFLNHDQWHIIGGLENLLAIAELNQDLCDETTGIQVVNAQILPHCIDFTPPNVINTRGHGGPRGSKILMVRKACSTGTGSSLSDCSADTEYWDIVDIQLRRYCPVIGLDDRTSCLVAAGLRTRGEWCPMDEPTVACPIVLYIDCVADLPSCDQQWAFAPEFACCGQGTSPGSGSGSAQHPSGATSFSPGTGPGSAFIARILKSK